MSMRTDWERPIRDGRKAVIQAARAKVAEIDVQLRTAQLKRRTSADGIIRKVMTSAYHSRPRR
jgi:hypothetical protein